MPTCGGGTVDRLAKAHWGADLDMMETRTHARTHTLLKCRDVLQFGHIFLHITRRGKHAIEEYLSFPLIYILFLHLWFYFWIEM